MRNLKLMLFFMTVAMTPFFTNCSKDKNETVDVSGTYTGTIKIDVIGVETPNSIAVLTKTGEKYTLQLQNLNFDLSTMIPSTIVAIGDVSITNVAISNGILSGGDEKSIDVTLPPALAAMAGATEVTVKVSLVNGTISDNNLKFTLIVNDVPAITTVPVSLDGNK